MLVRKTAIIPLEVVVRNRIAGSLAKKFNLQLIEFNEYFDDDDKNEIPRILSLLFQKNL